MFRFPGLPVLEESHLDLAPIVLDHLLLVLDSIGLDHYTPGLVPTAFEVSRRKAMQAESFLTVEVAAPYLGIRSPSQAPAAYPGAR